MIVFVNRIADIVHRSVFTNEGAPNKNVGDAFQLAWKIPERRKLGQQVTTADAALRSIIRILFETSTCPALYRLTANAALQARIPNYTTRFGFGLHAGWGIEGAIGSGLKIDPTYLSPNVKWSERLETATKVYGVLILMSDAFWDLLSPPVQKLCRKIDKIKVPDSKTPLDLYTYDTHAFALDDLDMKFFSPTGSTFWEVCMCVRDGGVWATRARTRESAQNARALFSLSHVYVRCFRPSPRKPFGASSNAPSFRTQRAIGKKPRSSWRSVWSRSPTISLPFTFSK